MVAGSKVITNHIGLSCFHSLLPSDAAFFNANQNQSPQSNLLPRYPFGIVVAATPGICTLIHVIKLSLPGTHPILSSVITGTKPSSLLWFFRTINASLLLWFNHTVGASLVHSIHFHRCCFLLLFVLSQQLVFLCVSFTLRNLLKSYGSSCSIIPHQTVFKFTPAVARLVNPRLRIIVVPTMALLRFVAAGPLLCFIDPLCHHGTLALRIDHGTKPFVSSGINRTPSTSQCGFGLHLCSLWDS
jgi:hypothetical protein